MGVAAADSTGDERVFPIDVEHAGIRLALPMSSTRAFGWRCRSSC